MKKTLSIFSILFLLSFISQAQDSLYIFKSGSIVTRRAVTDIDSILFKSFGALKAPEGLQATAANGQIALNWNVVSTATSYNIYRSTVQGVTKTNGTKISNVVSLAYINTATANGTKYYYVVTAVNSSGESGESAEVNASSFVPTDTGWGGVATLNVINGITYAVHTFNYNAIFYPPVNLTHARVLLVGSGGTGGGTDPNVTNAIGGGGGGGEVKDVDVVIKGSSMPVTISTDANSVSSFGEQTVTNGSAGVGGNGGGGGTSGNGIAGGIGQSRAGGGGGGATGHGTDGVADNWNPMGGKGGDGIMSNISGKAMYYGGGGGGGAYTGYSGSPGAGGAGGGGGGWAVKGVANTGGGGSGACYSSGGGGSSSTIGSSGGSGVVIISYQL